MGLIETDTAGERVMLAVPDFVESATLVAVTVTVCKIGILAGAV